METSLDLILEKAGRIPENILAKIATEVLHGLTCLSADHAVVRREVKPKNILVNGAGEIIKICDYVEDSEKVLHNMANAFMVESKTYSAPESIEKDEYSVQSDVWSLGLLLIEMATGVYPIPPPNLPTHTPMRLFEILEHIVYEAPPKLPKGPFSAEFEQFIDLCLQKNPDERAALETLLHHEWILRTVNEDVDIAKWLRRTMEIRPTILNEPSQKFKARSLSTSALL